MSPLLSPVKTPDGLEPIYILPLPPSLGLACKSLPASVYPTGYDSEAGVMSPKSSVSILCTANDQYMVRVVNIGLQRTSCCRTHPTRSILFLTTLKVVYFIIDQLD